ncbi:MAG: crossover junction endodeoxyribonuclease RuvC [Rickettsiales bacterium]|nr:crossover junction endodeoxyribonuclease RuvC [Rickettsiales bacterium]
MKNKIKLRIIGIDPSLSNTGWGIVDFDRTTNTISFVADGTITTDTKTNLQTRLHEIHTQITTVIEKYQPSDCAMEESFVNVNARTSLKMGMARGAITLSFALQNIPVSEYTPTMIKQAVSGSGRADKNQVSSMVRILLPTCKQPHSEHSSDALAIAIAHINSQTYKNL